MVLSRGAALALLGLACGTVRADEPFNHDNVACEFEVADGNAMMEAKLDVHFSDNAQPTVLTGLTEGWAAHEKWTPEQLMKDYGHLPVSSAEMTNGFRAMWDFSEQLYVKDVLNASLVFFTNKEVGKGMAKDMGEIPSYLRRHAGHLGVSLGARGAYATHHAHTASWFAQVKGRKLWVVSPPGVQHKWSDSYPDVCKMPEEAFVGLDVKRCVVKEGEVLYLPHQWGHSTCNLDQAVSAGVIGSFHSAVTFAVQLEDRAAVERYMKAPEWENLSVQGDAISFAAKWGHSRMMQFLVMSGVDMEGTNESTQPIMEASANGHANVLQYLVQRGVEPWPEDLNPEVTRPIEVAAANGHLSVVKELYSHCEECLSELQEFEMSPIHYAASEGHIPVLDFLIEVDNNTRGDARNQELLYLASRSGHVAAVDRAMKLLPPEDPTTARGTKSIGNGVQEHVLHVSAGNGHSRLVERLLSRNIAPDLLNKHGDQAIHHAAMAGAAHVVEFLVAAGASPEASTVKGNTPRKLAEHYGHQKVLEVLAGLATHDEL